VREYRGLIGDVKRGRAQRGWSARSPLLNEGEKKGGGVEFRGGGCREKFTNITTPEDRDCKAKKKK